MPVEFNDIANQQLRDQELHQRMDVDKNFYYLTPYEMRDDLDKPVAGVINVTLNQPATFAAHVNASIMGATRQIKVTGDKISEDAAKEIEDFINAALEDADRRLRKMGDPTLDPFATEQSTMRGRIAFRCNIRIKDGKFLSDILPVDTRYFSSEHGVDGMIWGSYKTFRSPAMVKSEHSEFEFDRKVIVEANSAGGHGNLELVEVQDAWDSDVNRIFVGGKIIKTVKHKYGEPPFILEIVPSGSMLQDTDRISRRGESIYSLIRTLINEANRTATIFQTHNFNTIQGAKTWHSPDGTMAEVPEDVGDPGTTTAASEGGGVKLVPQGDVNSGGQLVQGILSSGMQQGSISGIDVGAPPFPLSAVALVKLGESRGQVFLPRLGAKGLAFQQLSEMIIKQTLALGVDSVELGTSGHKRVFKTSDLKGEYDIEFLYDLKSPATDVALMSIAQVARQFFGTSEILDSILKVENPAETMRQKRLDDAELISPNVMRRRTVLALIEEGREIEARIIADEMGASIEELQSGEFEEPLTPAPQPGNPNDIAPLLPEATRAASNKRSSQLQGQAGGQEGRA